MWGGSTRHSSHLTVEDYKSTIISRISSCTIYSLGLFLSDKVSRESMIKLCKWWIFSVTPKSRARMKAAFIIFFLWWKISCLASRKKSVDSPQTAKLNEIHWKILLENLHPWEAKICLNVVSNIQDMLKPSSPCPIHCGAARKNYRCRALFGWFEKTRSGKQFTLVFSVQQEKPVRNFSYVNCCLGTRMYSKTKLHSHNLWSQNNTNQRYSHHRYEHSSFTSLL